MDSFVKDKNLNNNLFVTGDLNMNWLNDKGALLRTFCDENNLKNFVDKSTRAVYTKNYSSSTLIDVINN